MEQSSNILSEISKVTLDIQNNYPELQKYLDETRITLPKSNSEKTTNEDLKDYLNSLKEMIRKYKNK